MLLVGKATEHLEGFHLARKVEEGGRLIQDDEAGLLSQRFGNHHLLALAIA